MDFIIIMRQRRSVRTFDGRELLPEHRAALEDCLRHLGNPFGTETCFRLMDAEAEKLSSQVLVGERCYVGGKMKQGRDNEFAYGYALERFLLYAEGLGVNGVWLAGTIDRKAFERALNVGADEVMPAVSPLGYAAKKPSMRENLMRKAIKADERLPYEELFFSRDFRTPLTKAAAGPLAEALEMVRLAPSAGNKQPWRVAADGNRLHFYKCVNKAYGAIQNVDMGIALCHLELALNEAGKQVVPVSDDPHLSGSEELEYCFTVEVTL